MSLRMPSLTDSASLITGTGVPYRFCDLDEPKLLIRGKLL
jgi:hypothetical protein